MSYLVQNNHQIVGCLGASSVNLSTLSAFLRVRLILDVQSADVRNFSIFISPTGLFAPIYKGSFEPGANGSGFLDLNGIRPSAEVWC